MTDGQPTALRLHRALDPLFRTPPGWGWFAAVNHSDVGRRFLATAFLFFLFGGLLAMLIRAQLATPGSAFVGPDIYNQLFTMHGTVMMFLFAIPAIEGLALYLLPKVLGARDLAFPRLSAYGYWCYLLGGLIFIGSMAFAAAPDSGWFMYTPLSSRPYSPGINSDVWLIGVTFVEVSSVAGAIEIAATVLKVRAPGMALGRMPLLAWYLLVTAMMIIIGFPPLILGSILLEIERAFGWPFFDPTRGGDPILWQHLFWLFGHPEVYIIFLPAAGVLSTIIPVMARTTIVGYGWVVAAAIALGFLSFGLWVHHMFATGIPHLGVAFFSAASMLVVIPTGIQIFAWLATLVAGRPQMKLPMLYILGFFAIFVIGGLTGVMVAVVPFDWQAHDTHFIVAHLHYVLVGGFVFPVISGAYYWLPLITGRQRTFQLGKAAFWITFIGFNLTFLHMHLTGLLGMPRRIDSYADAFGWTGLNLVSSVGGFVSAIGFALIAIDLVMQFFSGGKAARNPWGAGSLEWAMMKPPPSYNFASLPLVDHREPLHRSPDLALSLARGEQFLGDVRHGWRETIGVDVLSGRADQIILLPGPTFLPLWTALATALFFGSLLAKLYLLALLGLAGVLALALCWAWQTGLTMDHGPLPIGLGQTAPPHAEAAEAPGFWGSRLTLLADGSLFASLLFGFAYLWTIAPGWPPPQWLAVHWPSAITGSVGLLIGWIASDRALGMTARGAKPWLALAIGGQLAGAAALLAIALLFAPAPASHAYGAVLHVLAAYGIVHSLLAAIITAFAALRISAGFVSARRTLDLRIAAQWQAFGAAAGVLILLTVHGTAALVQ